MDIIQLQENVINSIGTQRLTDSIKKMFRLACVHFQSNAEETIRSGRGQRRIESFFRQVEKDTRELKEEESINIAKDSLDEAAKVFKSLFEFCGEGGNSPMPLYRIFQLVAELEFETWKLFGTIKERSDALSAKNGVSVIPMKVFSTFIDVSNHAFGKDFELLKAKAATGTLPKGVYYTNQLRFIPREGHFSRHSWDNCSLRYSIGLVDGMTIPTAEHNEEDTEDESSLEILEEQTVQEPFLKIEDVRGRNPCNAPPYNILDYECIDHYTTPITDSKKRKRATIRTVLRVHMYGHSSSTVDYPMVKIWRF